MNKLSSCQASISTTTTTTMTKIAFRCEHFVITVECEECSSTMTHDQRSRFIKELKGYFHQLKAGHLKRLKAANEELKVQETPARKSRRKIRFQLDDLPAPVKDRELLYHDYYRTRKGMVQQWCSRLDTLSNNTAEWWRELLGMATK